MSDLINRNDAIKALWDEDINPSDDGMIFEAQSHIDRNIRLIPSAECNDWIPCSKRLPKQEEHDPELGVLVTLGNGYSGLDFDRYHETSLYDAGHWSDWDGYVIAWMPLPPNYEEKTDGR